MKYILNSYDYDILTGDIGSMEDVDNLLMRLDTGVEISLERNKAWSKYAKDIIAYVQKRLHLGKGRTNFRLVRIILIK